MQHTATRVTGTKTFAPGVITRRIRIPVVPDAVDEPDETFSAVLPNPIGAAIVDDTGVATSTDDDPPAISIGDVTVTPFRWP